MTLKTNLIAAGTAFAIAATALAPTANAAPFTAPTAATVTTSAEGVETVGHRHRHRRHNGAAAAVGLGAFALGLAIAADQNRYARDCYIERTKRWSNRLGAYVVREEKVCY